MNKGNDHNKKPKWNVRIKVPNTNGYVLKSTKKMDFNEGKRFSEDLYYELEGQVRRIGLDSNLYQRFHDVIIPSSHGTTQVDHILVSPFERK